MDLLRAKLDSARSSSNAPGGYGRSTANDFSSLGPVDQEAEKEKLFRKTSDAIKAVQRRFHGKHEIATASDSSIQLLCTQIEALFYHGLKAPEKRGGKKGGEHAFWPFVAQVIDSADSAQLSMLQNVSTDSGRGRAWIRWALNERSFDKFLQAVNSDPAFTGTCYDSWSFMADEDYVSRFSMLVVGLQLTVFAIELDVADLNTVKEFVVEQMPPVSFSEGAAPGRGNFDISAQNDTPAAAFVGFHEPMEVEKKDKKKKKKKKKKAVASVADIGALNDAPEATAADSSAAPAYPTTSTTPPYPATTQTSTSSLPAALSETPTPPANDLLASASELLARTAQPPAPAVPLATAGAGVLGTAAPATAGSSHSSDIEALLARSKALTQRTSSSAMTLPLSSQLPGTTAAPGAPLDLQTTTPPTAAVPPVQLESPPSPATIAKRALQMSRANSMKYETVRVAPVAAAATTSSLSSVSSAAAVSDDGMSADQLRQVLLGVMRTKDSLEAELQEMKKQKEHGAQKEAEAGGALQNADEELQGKTKRIGALEKENSLLKQQLKKYVAEAQQLKRQNRDLLEAQAQQPEKKPVDDAPGREYSGLDHMDNEERDEDDGDDSVPGGYASIEDMQAHHERQILQLSEMHCELIDLNERANQQLRARDKMIVSLGGRPPTDGAMGAGAPAGNRGGIKFSPASPMGVGKPARLAPPHPGIAIPGTSRPIINVWIPSALLKGKGSDSHHVYQIYVQVKNDEWCVYRRFTHFHDLHRQVQHIFAEASISLPRKKGFGRKSEKFVEERRRALEQYIRQIISLCLSQHRSPLVQNPCKQTLCEALPFLREKFSSVTSNAMERKQAASGGGGGYGGF